MRPLEPTLDLVRRRYALAVIAPTAHDSDMVPGAIFGTSTMQKNLRYENLFPLPRLHAGCILVSRIRGHE